MLETWKRRAPTVRRDIRALYLARRDPRIPWHVRLLAVAIVAYALCPIDLIPDFIPVLGYLDDLIIVPLGIWLVIALIPEEIMREHRATANAAAQRPVGNTAAIVIGALWLSGAALLGWIALVHWRL